MVEFIHSMLNFKKMSPAQKIAASFLLVILCGTLLLMLPISNADGNFMNPIDALFSATSATCVTGLSTINVSEQLNLFGQIVLMLLIQIGGLGLMTFMAVFLLIIKSRLSLNEKIVMKEMLNQEHVFNMKKFIVDILYYTLFFETIGAILLSIPMIEQYGLFDGSFKAIFLAVSAFCNAGFDTLGSTSLQAYVDQPLICFTIMALIVLGGLGFAVWFDVRDKLVSLVKGKLAWKKFRRSLSLHTKLVLFVTFLLIVSGAVFIVVFEYNNSATLRNMPFPQKIMCGLFESISLRTAGFTSIDYGALQSQTSLIMMVLMFIGGCPGGTAGGIKTTTFIILVIYIIGMLKGSKQTVVFRRAIEESVVIRAMGIFFLNLVVLFVGVLLLCIIQSQDFLSIAFECVSALATVGSSLGLTDDLEALGKIVIICMMYIGRIGISTLVLSMMRQRSFDENKISLPKGNIIVG